MVQRSRPFCVRGARDECGRPDACNHTAEEIDGKDVARADVEVRALQGDQHVEAGWDQDKGELERGAQPAAGNGEESEREKREHGERGLDEEDDGEVHPRAVRVDAAEEEDGHVVGHAADVGKAVEPAFGQQAPVREEEDAVRLRGEREA